MSVLMIAPTRADLPNVATEAAAVVNALGGRLVQGQVTEKDVRDACTAGQFDGIWFATHTSCDRVLLSEESLSEAALVAYVAASGAAWCVLNSCQSIVLGQRIIDETLADVICTVAANPDPEAMRTGVLFARQLALLGETRAAYERSKPGGNRLYVYLDNYRRREMTTIGGANAYPAAQDRLQTSMDQMSRDMSKISTDVEVLKERTTSIDARLAKIENIVRPPASLPTWSMLVLGLVAAVAIIFVLIRAGT
jgi:hypothetical protein